MIRKAYSRIADKLIRQKKVALLARIAFQFILIQLSRKLGRPLSGPLVAMMIVTYRCNLRCAYCDMPGNACEHEKNAVLELDTKALCVIIDDLRRLGVNALAFTGGEPLLRQDIYELMTYAKSRGMITHISTNGVLVGSDEARRLIETGVDSISVSIDGSCAEIHERTRKTPGVFNKALRGLELLIALRNSVKSSTRIKIYTVVGNSNISDIHNVLNLARQMGVDGVELMPCQPLLAEGNGDEFVYDDAFIARVESLITDLMADRELRGLLDNSDKHLALFKRSFEGKASPLACFAGYASIIVDCYGDVFPCLPNANWRRAPVNIGSGTLVDLWESGEYQARRAKTEHCSGCYLNCQAELSIMLGLGRTSGNKSEK